MIYGDIILALLYATGCALATFQAWRDNRSNR